MAHHSEHNYLAALSRRVVLSSRRIYSCFCLLRWCCCCCCRRTAYAKVQARLQFPEDYPTTSTSPIVELTSTSLPQPFLRKLTKSAEEAARNVPTTATETGGTSSGGETGGKGKAVAALKVVVNAVNKNKFLPCWKELRKAATLVTSR